MVKLAYAISKVVVDEFGQQEFLRRLSDPLWFQAFGCILGFDWHSSGVTTVVTGVLKQALNEDVHSISIAGGKGKKSTETKNDIPKLAEKHYNLSSSKIDNLLYASRMAAKIDNAALQDGYSLYLKSFISEPHAGIISKSKSPDTLNMTSIDSAENQKICVELARGDINNLKSSVYKITETYTRDKRNTLDKWITADTSDNDYKMKVPLTEHYWMPRRLNWDLFRKIYDIQPQNYEQLVSIPGVGPSAIRALSLIGEIIFGAKASWQNPVKYNFAHGGKDGVPFPIARKIYDKSISYLTSAIEGAEIERQERIQALKILGDYSARMFNRDGTQDII